MAKRPAESSAYADCKLIMSTEPKCVMSWQKYKNKSKQQLLWSSAQNMQMYAEMGDSMPEVPASAVAAQSLQLSVAEQQL